MAKSTHEVLVYEIPEMRDHEGADRLSLVSIGGDGGYQVVVNKEQWRPGQLCAFVPPDSLVDTGRPEFKFLDKKGTGGQSKIRACKLRGKLSYGLLVPAPEGSKVGDDVREILGVEHYEPVPPSCEDHVSGPGHIPKYDVEALKRYTDVLKLGEPVYVSEKLNGENARFVWERNAGEEGQLHVGSRTNWKANTPRSNWWNALRNTPQIEDFCRHYPNHTLYGEICGHVGGYKYGLPHISFRAFDILRPDGGWCNPDAFLSLCQGFKIPHVPVLRWNHPFNLKELEELAEQDSVLCPGQIMEGVVVKPMQERWDANLGRVCLKLVSARYLMS